MEADYADDAGRQIPVDFDEARSVLSFSLVKRKFKAALGR